MNLILTPEEYMELVDVLQFTIDCLDGDDERTEVLDSILTKLEVDE